MLTRGKAFLRNSRRHNALCSYSQRQINSPSASDIFYTEASDEYVGTELFHPVQPAARSNTAAAIF